jgi:hypothetical protein
MDLSQENLVPFRTLAKTRSGHKALYAGASNLGAYDHTFILTEDAGWVDRANRAGAFFHSTGLGRYKLDDNDDPGDIVSILKPRKLQRGDRVSITGPIIAEEVDCEGDYSMAYVEFVDGFEATLRNRARTADAGEYWNFNSSHGPDTWTYTVDRKHIKFLGRD